MSISYPDIKIAYLELAANQDILYDLPKHPYIAILAIYNNSITPDWQNQCADWIVNSKYCYQAMAWGYECSSWDDALDFSYLESCNYFVNDDYDFMTTWHQNQKLEDVIEFAEFCVRFPNKSTAPHIVLINIR